jgi:hypothetical protein
VENDRKDAQLLLSPLLLLYCTVVLEDHSHAHNKHDEEKEHHDHHGHGHAKKEEEIPAWKKRAMETGDDPMAAPFGGTWNMESSLSASDGAKKMED